MKMLTKQFYWPILITVVLLSLVFLAMQLTDQVNWGLVDFVIAAALLLSTGVLYELVTSRLKKTWQRVAVGVVLLIVLLLVWAQLAVGVF